MIYSSSRNSEFGPVPEEDAVVREKDLTPAEDGLGLKKEAGPAPEDTSPAPEMIEPGTFPWSSGKKDGKKLLARQGVFLAAAALTLLFTVGWFDAEKPQDNPPDPPSVTSPTVTEATEPQAVETTQPQKTEPVVAQPSCEIIAYAFSSEIYGDIRFENMEGVSKVTLSLWDTLTNTEAESFDITEEARTTGKYHIEPFYTDIFYQQHKDQYDAISEYPIEAELRVTVEYSAGEKTESASFSQVTHQEQDAWYIVYTPESGYASNWSFPGHFMLMTFDSPEEMTVLFDEPEKAAPGVLSIHAEIDGRSIITEDAQIRTETVQATLADGATATRYRTMVIISRPEDLPENGGKVAKFTVTQYLQSYRRVWDTVVEVPF